MEELKKRLLFVFGAILVYRIGTYIPVPGINPAALANFFEQQSGTIIDMFNMFSGGALERFSILALGIMPYISASIIMQLMSATMPSLKEIKKKERAEERKLRNILGMALCCYQLFRLEVWPLHYRHKAYHFILVLDLYFQLLLHLLQAQCF